VLLKNCPLRFYLLMLGPMLLVLRFAAAQELRHETIVGRVESIDREPNRILIICTGLVRGKQSLIGRSFDATTIAEFGKESVYWLRSRADFYRTVEDELVTRGESYVFDLLVTPAHVIEARPLRCADREIAKEELASRYAHLYELYDPLTTAQREELEGEFLRVRPRFWSEHIEGASLHPRTDYISRYLLSEQEKETGTRWALRIVSDKNIDTLTRAATTVALIRKTPSFCHDPRAGELLQELRDNAKTSEDATALKALLDAICGAFVETPPKIPSVNEIILEALDESKRTEEYRIAFAKRLRIAWRDPFRKPAFQAMLKALETESVEGLVKPNPGIRNAVGDWILYRLSRGSTQIDAKKLGLEAIDYSRLHPTVRARLDLPDPNKIKEEIDRGN
jgi:hypothetical protein